MSHDCRTGLWGEQCNREKRLDFSGSLTVTTSGSYRQIKDQFFPHLQNWGGRLGGGWEFGDCWGRHHGTGSRLVSFSIDKAAADKAAADQVTADKAAAEQAASLKAATDKVAADKAVADKAAADKALADLTAERDTFKTERDTLKTECDALKAEVDRLEKLTGKAAKPPATGGGLRLPQYRSHPP